MNRLFCFVIVAACICSGCGAPSRNYSQLSLAKNYVNLGQNEDAKKILEKTDFGKEPEAYYYLGKIYFEENDLNKAKQHLDHAVSHYVHQAPSYCLLAGIGIHNNDADYARQMFMKAFDHRSDDPECYNKFGLMSYALGQKELARSAFCKAMNLDSHNVIYSDNLKNVGADCRDIVPLGSGL